MCLCILPTDVPLWLKSLRLHKYQYLFVDLTYEEMLQMAEEHLEDEVRQYVSSSCYIDQQSSL